MGDLERIEQLIAEGDRISDLTTSSTGLLVAHFQFGPWKEKCLSYLRRYSPPNSVAFENSVSSLNTSNVLKGVEILNRAKKDIKDENLISPLLHLMLLNLDETSESKPVIPQFNWLMLRTSANGQWQR